MKKLPLAALALLCIVIAWLAFVLTGAGKRRVIDQRMADVQTLTRIYREELEKMDGATGSPKISDTEDLLRIVETKGIKLHSPIPEDPSKPCYRVVYTTGNTKSRILIEETNVADHRNIVRSTIDGSVFMQRLGMKR